MDYFADLLVGPAVLELCQLFGQLAEVLHRDFLAFGRSVDARGQIDEFVVSETCQTMRHDGYSYLFRQMHRQIFHTLFLCHCGIYTPYLALYQTDGAECQ